MRAPAAYEVGELLATYRACRAKDTVFLLNVGPRVFGDIHPEEQAVMRRLGRMIRGGDRGR